MYDNLNPILNQQVRLAVISILLKVQKADFKYLQEQTSTTQGNLSHQLKKLQESEYISVEKTFEKNYPRTYCSITSAGKKAFEEYVKQMKKYLNI